MRKSDKIFLGILIIPLILITFTSFFVYFFNPTAATIISYGGTMLVMLNAILYVIFFDSKKRWKNTTARQRAYNLFTFKR